MRSSAVAAIFAGAFGYRALLIALWPPCYGGDALGRLEHAGDPLWSPVQLPLTGILVWLFAHVTFRPLAQRIGFAAIASLAAALVGASLVRVAGRRAAMLTALVLATNPVFTEWTVVPYGEGVLVGTLLPGLALWYVGPGVADRVAGILLIAVATTVRYEAWIVYPILLVLRPPVRAAILSLLSLPLVFPLAWTWHARGVSPIGLRSLDLHVGLSRIAALVYPVGGTVLLATPPLVAFAIAGLREIRSAAKRDLAALDPSARRLLQALALGAALDVAFVAAFRPYAPIDNPRQAILPCAILAIFAGIGIDRAERDLPRLLYPYPRPRPSILVGVMALLLTWPLLQGALRVRRSALADDARIGYELGRRLDRELADGSTATISAPPRRDFPDLEPTVIRWVRVNVDPRWRGAIAAVPSTVPTVGLDVRHR
ncbi:MAG: hypothetical protein U0166_08610 [Acidobacteriota bacterium]